MSIAQEWAKNRVDKAFDKIAQDILERIFVGRLSVTSSLDAPRMSTTDAEFG